MAKRKKTIKNNKKISHFKKSHCSPKNKTSNVTCLDSELLLKISIDNIPLLRMNPAIYLYDLKYIFELLFINQDHLLEDKDIESINKHFYIHYYDHLKQCLHKDRYITEGNILDSKDIPDISIQLKYSI